MQILKWVLLAALAAVAVSYLYVPVIATLRDISFREATEKGRKIFRRCWIQTLALDIQITTTPSEDGNRTVPALFANIPIKDMKNGNPEK